MIRGQALRGRYPAAEVFRVLNLDPAQLDLCADWDQRAGLRADEAAARLEAGFVVAMAQAAGLDDDRLAALLGFRTQILRDEAVLAFFAYCLDRVQTDQSLVESWEPPWPALDARFGSQAGLVNVLVMLAALPEALSRFERMGLPPALVTDTLADLRRWMDSDVYFQKSRTWGITPWIARWLCKHWRGLLLQLGRLQFSPGRFEGPLDVFRERATGRVLALARAGQKYRSDGQAWGPCCGAEPAWVSRRGDTEDQWIGTVISAQGHALPEPRVLPRSLWQRVLGPGDPVLHLHVPAGPGLDFDECGRSFRQALEVFPRYCPQTPFLGFSTGSWLMDPRWQDLLRPDANITRLQRELYLYPGLQGDNRQILERVFGWGVTDCRQVEWTTSLQRAVGPLLAEGGHFHGGYFFLLKEDLAWGLAPYRREV